ncbi:MAG: alpha amylase N-terminal ig-like domain-containing protein [Bacillota bacterium]
MINSISVQALTEPEPGLLEVEFSYEPPIAVDEVFLAGEFNDWNPQDTLMTDEDGDGVYTVTVYLEPGEYQYKFVIDGTNWQTPEDADDYAPDGFGGQNAVIIVGDNGEKPQEPGVKGDGEITSDMLHYNNQQHRFFNPIGSNRISIRLQTRLDDIETVEMHIYEAGTGRQEPVKEVNLNPFLRFDNFEYYRSVIEPPAEKFNYMFVLEDGDSRVYYGAEGAAEEPAEAVLFESDLNNYEIFSTPSWIYDAVFYQIFPDRFANGSSDNDPQLLELYEDNETRYESYIPAWDQGIKPSDDPVPSAELVVDGDNSINPQAGYYVFYGGDLFGVENKIPYLKGLGINTIYFNPIFKASANHRYNTAGYEFIDENLAYPGEQEKSQEYFVELVDKLEDAGIKVILDGVFNHVGYEHWAFQDLVEKGEDSEYVDWFTIHDFPIIPLAEQSESVEPNYEGWWGYGHMPELNLQNPEVKEYIFEITEKWLDMGISGWRLDVPMDVKATDPDFWKEWREFVKDYDEEIYLTGEVWDNAQNYLEGDEFDGVMNYRFRDRVFKFVGQSDITAPEFHNQMMKLFFDYPEQAVFSLQNLLGSHDTRRYLTMLKGNKARFRLSMFLQFTYPGSPMIYYGDEIGMEGGEDPDNRRTMIWEDRGYVEPDEEIKDYVINLIQLRKDESALRQGSIQLIETDNDQVYGFLRDTERETLLVLLNNTEEEISLKLSESDLNPGFSKIGLDDFSEIEEIKLEKSAYRDIYQNRNHFVTSNKITVRLPALDGSIIRLR